jgi:hypothetical protein
MIAKNGDFARNREIVLFVFWPFFAMFHVIEFADFGRKRLVSGLGWRDMFAKSRILYRCPGGWCIDGRYEPHSIVPLASVQPEAAAGPHLVDAGQPAPGQGRNHL